MMAGETKEILEMRRNFYAFLYRMYLEEPPKELADDLVKGKISFPDLIPLDEELSEGFRGLKEFMEKDKDKAADELYENLVDEFTLLFIGPHRLPVQPYESWWMDGKLMGESLLKVKRACRKAGIVKSGDYAEPEDHIAFELKFMHYLCEEELSSDNEERIEECLNLQKEFLNDHLLRWVPDFCDALYECELSNFYKGIAKLTKGFLLLEDAVIDELLEMETVQK
ncbi:MAG: molecular chaperone TorD family protein [Methanophagales archaeon]|nr:molecular chaperone TorD family protein [Methanophagales archaeon]